MVDFSKLRGKCISVDEANDIISEEDSSMNLLLRAKYFFLFSGAIFMGFYAFTFNADMFAYIFANFAYFFCIFLEYRRLNAWHEFFEDNNIKVDYYGEEK